MKNLLGCYADGENTQQKKTNNTSYRLGSVQKMLHNYKLQHLSKMQVKGMRILLPGFKHRPHMLHTSVLETGVINSCGQAKTVEFNSVRSRCIVAVDQHPKDASSMVDDLY